MISYRLIGSPRDPSASTSQRRASNTAITDAPEAKLTDPSVAHPRKACSPPARRPPSSARRTVLQPHALGRQPDLRAQRVVRRALLADGAKPVERLRGDAAARCARPVFPAASPIYWRRSGAHARQQHMRRGRHCCSMPKPSRESARQPALWVPQQLDRRAGTLPHDHASRGGDRVVLLKEVGSWGLPCRQPRGPCAARIRSCLAPFVFCFGWRPEYRGAPEGVALAAEHRNERVPEATEPRLRGIM